MGLEIQYPDLIREYGSSPLKGKVFLVAEAGTGHLGNLEVAAEMVDLCAQYGAAVKFQHVIADEILHPLCGRVPLSSGGVDLYRYFKEIEQKSGREFWERLMGHCRERGVPFLCSFFGSRSFLELREWGVGGYKIASPEMNYSRLWKYLLPEKEPVFFSSGVAKQEDIANLMDFLQRNRMSRDRLTHLHCVTQYPASPEDYDLLFTQWFEMKYGILTGLSDHTPDPFLLPAIFTAFKARKGLPSVIEKHLTLSGIKNNIDDPVAIDEQELGKLMKLLGAVSTYFTQQYPPPSEGESWTAMEWVEVIGQGFAHLSSEERIAFVPEVDRDTLIRVLGKGHRHLSSSEAVDYPTTKRSLLATKDIRSGDSLSEENTAYLRSEKNLYPGLDYTWEEEVPQLKIKRSIRNGESIREEDLLPYHRSAGVER